jgi:chromosome partitioning protein
MRAVAVVNQKGGCGKTTTAINAAAAMAEMGRRVLLLDLDPQAHATIGVGRDPNSFPRTVYDVLTSPATRLADVAVRTGIDHLDLAPCNVLLAGTELKLAGVPGKELLLARALRDVRETYDVCVIDCPPSLGILTVNALVASTDIVVPVQVQYYALEGLRRLLETVAIIRRRFHAQSPEDIGLLLTFVENQTMFSRQVQAQLREIFGEMVFKAVIHRNVRLTEAPSAGEPVLTYAPQSKAAADYRALAAEILRLSPSIVKSGRDRIQGGLKKQLSAIFDGVWIPTRQRTHRLVAPIRPHAIEST